MQEILKFLLKLVPTSILNKLQNLPAWAYVIVIAITGGLSTLYQYYTGKGLANEGAAVNLILLAITALFGAKALPAKAADEFDVPDGK